MVFTQKFCRGWLTLRTLLRALSKYLHFSKHFTHVNSLKPSHSEVGIVLSSLSLYEPGNGHSLRGGAGFEPRPLKQCTWGCQI